MWGVGSRDPEKVTENIPAYSEMSLLQSRALLALRGCPHVPALEKSPFLQAKRLREAAAAPRGPPASPEKTGVGVSPAGRGSTGRAHRAAGGEGTRCS